MDEAVNENFKDGTLQASLHPLPPLDAGPWSSLPAGAPLDMPEQNFAAHIERAREPRRRGYWVPRAAIFTGAAVLTAAFAHELFSILAFVVITPVQFLFLILSTIAFGWIAVGSLSAALGFLPLFAGEHPDTIEPPLPSCRSSRERRCCFRSITRSRRGSREPSKLWLRELQTLGKNKNFDVFVLSDTRGEAQGAVRQTFIVPCAKISPRSCRSIIAAAAKIRRVNPATSPIGSNASVRDYQSFVILDGDSVMSGATLVSLAIAMMPIQRRG